LGQTDGHGYIDSAIDADQEYMYSMATATAPSACYPLFFHKLNRPFVLFYSIGSKNESYNNCNT